jgi:hypothetical protein
MARHVVEVVLMQSILIDEHTSVSVSILSKVLEQDHDRYARVGCVPSMLQTPSYSLQSLCFLELSDISEISSGARTDIYQSDNGAVWLRISGICIETLNDFSKSLYAALKTGSYLEKSSFFPNLL